MKQIFLPHSKLQDQMKPGIELSIFVTVKFPEEKKENQTETK